MKLYCPTFYLAPSEYEPTMSRSSVSFGDNHHHECHHRQSLPSIFRHRVGPDGNFMVTPIKLVDR